MPVENPVEKVDLNVTPTNSGQGINLGMKRLRFTVVKNAASNLIRGGASAAVALALPYFLTHSLSRDKFAAWSLILQIAAYASYLDFGLQTAVARFLAQAIELHHFERCRRIVNTALILLSGGAIIAMILLGLVILNQHRLFPGVPVYLSRELEIAAAILGVSAAAQLPLSTYGGILIGLHRNELLALAIGVSRILGAAAAIFASRYTHSLIVLALCIGGANLLGGLAQLFMATSLAPYTSVNRRNWNHGIAKELAHYCLGLTVFSFSMLLVSGLDVTIVGILRFSAVGYYSIATSLITFMAGLNNSALSALLTPIAVLHARNEKQKIADIILHATRLNTAVNLALTIFLFAFGYPLVKLWCGVSYADTATPIIRILAVAQLARLTMTSYSIALISTGQQNRASAPALAEAFTNLLLSLIGGFWLGPIGVAWGTLAGVCCGILWVVMRTMKRTSDIPLSAKFFLANGILPVLIAGLPLCLFLIWHRYQGTSLLIESCIFTIAVSLSILLFSRLKTQMKLSLPFSTPKMNAV